MIKYIDADRLRAEIENLIGIYGSIKAKGVLQEGYKGGRLIGYEDALNKLNSLQQDDTQVDKMLCSRIWWEEQRWMMIPPDATIEGIDYLLKQVRKKLQQEQPEVDLEKELDQWRHEHFAGERDGHYSGEYLERSSQLDIARHFFNLGLNSRKDD